MHFDIKTLEFPKIKKEIEKYFIFDESIERLNLLFPLTNKEEIKKNLCETEEMRMMIVTHQTIPFVKITDFLKTLKKIEIFSTLTVKEVLSIYKFNNSVSSILEYLKALKKDNFNIIDLNEYFSSLFFIKELKTEIERIVDEEGIILDTASKELYDIRKNIKTYDNKIKNKLQEIIQSKNQMLADTLIVLRNNRYCVLVKQEYKNQFKGVIHDESASGQTIFIEPEAVLILTNQLQSSLNEEKKEIEKILIKLTAYLNNYLEILKINYQMILNLDFISGKANYAIEIDGCIPELSNNDLKLINARHPLIDKNKVVPINIELGQNYQGIIITGPNTGGKTVTLKTVGLLQIMAQSGILIPADINSKIQIFDNIFVDIGDEQSIEQSLSTFSSHLKKIIFITENITENSLVLIDELGSGTDPFEGSSLARSILTYLKKFDIRMIITSHYTELKEFAYQNKEFTNASVLFNIETLEPTYKLKIGIPGRSNALEISKKLGLKEEIINNAKDILEHQSSDIGKIIKKLEKEEHNISLKEEELNNKILEIESKNKELEKRLNEIENEKNQVLKNANLEAEKYISELKKKGSSLLNDIKSITKEHEVAQAKFDLKNITKENISLDKPNNHLIKVNDIVFVTTLEKEGIVKKISKDKATVILGNISLDFPLSDLRYVREYKPVKKDFKPVFDTSSIKREGSFRLDLRGFRYEDAKEALDKYFDNAIVCNIKQFQIIHGFGTGTIRKLVQEYLKNNKHVDKYRYGEEGEGLNGVTVVYLK